jgi:hypothetical protein
MTPSEWAQLAVAITSIVAAVALGVKWLVKRYLAELKPNGGSSLKDSVSRLEVQMDLVIKMLTKENK